LYSRLQSAFGSSDARFSRFAAQPPINNMQAMTRIALLILSPTIR
jgi:hypothetical protein